MKKQIYLLKHIVLFSLVFPCTTFAGLSKLDQDSLGMDGDHLDLEAVLGLFEKSESLEEFEKGLNLEKNGINNLDLNQDGEVDYLRVVDEIAENDHAISLIASLSDEEEQTVAVIEIQKEADENAVLQIVGDEDLYGKDYIVEPYEGDKSDKELRSSLLRPVIVVNVWSWRPVRFIYGPRYTLWVSPYRYKRYPTWWKPWRPLAWKAHRARCHRHRYTHVHRVGVYRCTRSHKIYTANRHRSATVSQRNKARNKNAVHAKSKQRANIKSKKQTNNSAPKKAAKKSQVKANKKKVSKSRAGKAGKPRQRAAAHKSPAGGRR